MSTLNTQLAWRYATKRMNGKVVPQEKIDSILESIRLAPSSYGLTPYSIFVISDKETLKKIQPTAYMQPQIVEGSHLLVFAAWENVTEKNVDDFMNLVAETRGMPVSALADYKKMIWGGASTRSAEANFNWSARQAYIALGMGLAAAALEEVDSTPMEGFDPAKLDEVLGLKAKGLKSVALLALGYRDEKADTTVNYKKVRRSAKDLFTKI
jgi:nitroreductase